MGDPGRGNKHGEITTRKDAMAFIKKQETRTFDDLKSECHSIPDDIDEMSNLQIEKVVGIQVSIMKKLKQKLAAAKRANKKLDSEIKGVFSSELHKCLEDTGIISLYKDTSRKISKARRSALKSCATVVTKLNEEFSLESQVRVHELQICIHFEKESTLLKKNILSKSNVLLERFRSNVGSHRLTANFGASSSGGGGASGSLWSTKRIKRRKNLPRKAKQVMMSWLNKNLKKPHPTELEKKKMAKEAGVSIEQVCNWFVNARVRYVPKALGLVKKRKENGGSLKKG